MIIDGLIGILGGAFLLGTLGSEKISETADTIRRQQRQAIEQQYKDMFAAPREMIGKVEDLILNNKRRDELYAEIGEDLKFILGEGHDIRKDFYIPNFCGGIFSFDVPASNLYRVKNLLLAHQGKIDWECSGGCEGFSSGNLSSVRAGMRTIYLVEQYLRKFYQEEGKLYFYPNNTSHGFEWDRYHVGTMIFKPFFHLPEMANDPRARLWENEDDLKKFDNYCE